MSHTMRRKSGATRAVKLNASLASEAAKVVSFIDLAGHERYLRTTVYGLTAHEPDYVMVVVGANHGITRMTKEHVGMAIALNVPLFVVVTKVDLCPEPVMRETMKQLHRLLKLPGARKQPARAQKPSVHSSTITELNASLLLCQALAIKICELIFFPTRVPY